MNIIAFDTASDIFAVGLSVGLSPEAHTEEKVQNYCLEITGGKRHSELIMDGADALLQMAHIKKTDINAVACMKGPGSFTGLRIGFSAAKGLALALEIPLIPVPTLDCLAASLSFWPGITVPLLDAKKNAFFAALFHKGNRLGGYLDIGIDQLISRIKEAQNAVNEEAEKTGGRPSPLLTGPAADLAFPALSAAFPKTALDPACRRSHTAELLNLAVKQFMLYIGKKNAHIENRVLLDSGPMYLRKSDAEINNGANNG